MYKKTHRHIQAQIKRDRASWFYRSCANRREEAANSVGVFYEWPWRHELCLHRASHSNRLLFCYHEFLIYDHFFFFFYKCTCDFSGSTADWRPQLDARFPSNSGDCWTHEMMGDTSAGVLPPPTFALVGGGVTIKDPPIHQTINLATIYLATTI